MLMRAHNTYGQRADCNREQLFSKQVIKFCCGYRISDLAHTDGCTHDTYGQSDAVHW